MTKGRVLIIDDNPNNIQVLANVLDGEGYEVEVGLSGAEAMDWLEDEYFDLLMLDIMMPKINGFETCIKIREDKKHELMPIIFISAKTDVKSMVDGFKSGGQDYITKPFDNNELLARVSTHIELKKSKEQLIDINVGLEEKIKQRTKALDAANKELETINNVKDKYLSFIGNQVSRPIKSINKVLDVIKYSSESTLMAEMISLLDHSVDELTTITHMAKQMSDMNATVDKEISEFSLLQCLEHVLSSMDDILDAKDIELFIDFDDIQLITNVDNFRNALRSILTVILNSIDDQQIISFSAQDNEGETIFTIEGQLGSFANSKANMPEKVLLYIAYNETIMAIQGGSFTIDSKEGIATLNWNFKKQNK